MSLDTKDVKFYMGCFEYSKEKGITEKGFVAVTLREYNNLRPCP